MIARLLLAALAALALTAGATPRKRPPPRAATTAADAKAALETNCGCSIDVVVETESYRRKSDAVHVNKGLASVERAAGRAPGLLCSADQKDDTCNRVKAIHVGYRKINAVLEHGVKSEGTTLVCVTAANLYCSADEFLRVLKAAATP